MDGVGTTQTMEATAAAFKEQNPAVDKTETAAAAVQQPAVETAGTQLVANWWPDGFEGGPDRPALSAHDGGPSALEAAQQMALLPKDCQAWDASDEGFGPGATWRRCWVWRPGCPASLEWTSERAVEIAGSEQPHHGHLQYLHLGDSPPRGDFRPERSGV